MSTLQKLSFALVGTAIVFMSVKPASAVSLTPVTGTGTISANRQEDLFTHVPGTQTITFDTIVQQSAVNANNKDQLIKQGALIQGSNGTLTSADGFVTYSTPDGSTPAIVQGGLDGHYGKPLNDESKYLTISQKGSGVEGATGEVDLKFAQALDYFGLYWGSVDTYNSIKFYRGDTLLKTFTGTDVPGAAAQGNQQNSLDNVFVNFFADKNEMFDKIALISTAPAFESDNHAYRVASVPESSAMFGLLAVGALGAGSFLKRKQTQIV